jgi:hypothetical protein
MEQQVKNQALTAERVIVGFIVAAASVCVGLITVYLYMFDGSTLLH